ncbi:3-oxoacyl-[acyl-carrier-protein] reductase FabG [Rickettsiales bacterium Ac37b]|nr:3-oxoacyl-[acyl-carrier-protein] reductase FabG [Rickettsiales bacterium Ac37b]
MTRLAIVTGGTRGIGKSTAISLQNTGYKVVVNYAQNEETAKNFEAETGIKTYKWNVANFDECKNNIKKIEDEYGASVDVLINNAGITRDGFMHKHNYLDWSEVIQTNLVSCFNMSHAVLTQMREKLFGRIVNLSSINGLTGQIGQTNYSAAKAGVLGFTKALARENAPKNVTVNAIAPGYVKTDMVENIKSNVLDQIVQQIPVGRMGEPHEIARAVLFLVSDDAGFITGETISVNGGHYM